MCPRRLYPQGDVEADLRDCPYDDDTRYIRYADLHSHNSMEAFFSPKDDQDEQGTGLYLVMGQVNRFSRSCGRGSPAMVLLWRSIPERLSRA